MRTGPIRGILAALLAVVLLLIVSCGNDRNPLSVTRLPENETTDDETIPPENLAPEIQKVSVVLGSIQLSPSSLYYIPLDQTVDLTCFSEDPEGDTLTTSWTADYGTFNRSDSCSVEWLAPGASTEARIIVTVSDGHHQVRDTVRVAVTSPGPWEPDGTWERSYNLGTYEDGQDILRADDGGYIVLVSHGSVHLAKIAGNGTLVWDRCYYLGGSFWARSITALADGGYAITGSRRTLDGTTMLWDVFVLKVDAAGNFVWVKIFDGEVDTQGYDVVGTPDGGLLIAGAGNYFGTTNEGVYLVRTDSNGELLWQKTYPGKRATAMISTSTGGYAITGETGVWCSGSSDAFLLLVDAGGNVIHQSNYGDTDGELAFGVAETPGGGFAVAGQAYSISSQSWDGFLFLTDPEGNLTQWTDFGGDDDDIIRDVVNRRYGGFAVAGYTKSFGNGGCDMYLTAFDASGNFEWGKTFGGPELEEGQALVRTEDDGFVVVGRTMSFSVDLCDLYVVKTDPNGEVGGTGESLTTLGY